MIDYEHLTNLMAKMEGMQANMKRLLSEHVYKTEIIKYIAIVQDVRLKKNIQTLEAAIYCTQNENIVNNEYFVSMFLCAAMEISGKHEINSKKLEELAKTHKNSKNS